TTVHVGGCSGMAGTRRSGSGSARGGHLQGLYFAGADGVVGAEDDPRGLQTVVRGQLRLAVPAQGGDKRLVLQLQAFLLVALLGPGLFAVEERGRLVTIVELHALAVAEQLHEELAGELSDGGVSLNPRADVPVGEGDRSGALVDARVPWVRQRPAGGP